MAAEHEHHGQVTVSRLPRVWLQRCNRRHDTDRFRRARCRSERSGPGLRGVSIVDTADERLGLFATAASIDGSEPIDFGAVLQRDGAVYFPMMWYDEDEDRGPAGAALVRVSPETDERVWLRVLEESEVPVPADATPDVVEERQGWQWYLLDVESGALAARNADRPIGSYHAYAFRVDGRTYTTESDAEYTESTIVQIGAEGSVAGPTVQGTVRGLARLR